MYKVRKTAKNEKMEENTARSTPTSQRGKPGRRSSVVWQVFRPIAAESGKGFPRSKCDLCEEICKNPNGCTTAMRNHLFRKHPEVMSRLQEEQRNSRTTPVLGGGPVAPEPLSEGDQKSTSNSEETKMQLSFTATPFVNSIDTENIMLSAPPNLEEMLANQTTVPNVGAYIPPVPLFTVPQVQPWPMYLHPYVQNNLEKYKSIALMCVMDLLPLKTITTPAFRAILTNFTEGNNPLPSNDALTSIVLHHIGNMYLEEKQRLREVDGKFLCITVECVSRSNVDHLALFTVNYVSDDWILKSSFLGIRQLQHITVKSSNGEIQVSIEAALLNVLHKHQIDRSNVAAIIINSGYNHDSENIAQCSSGVMLPCFHEVVRLACEKLITSESVVNLFELICDISRGYFSDVKTLAGNPGLLLSKFVKIRRYVEPAIEAAEYSWSDVERLVTKLEPLTILVEVLLSAKELIPVAAILPLLMGLRRSCDSLNIQEPDSDLLPEVQAYLMNSYRLDFAGDRTGDTFNFLALASFFDPRYKRLDCLPTKMRAKILQHVLEMMIRNDDDFTRRTMDQDRSSQSGSLPNFVNRQTVLSSRIGGLDRELKYYFSSPPSHDDMDPCFWWKMNTQLFPRLSRLAKKYTCVRGAAMRADVMFAGADAEFYEKLLRMEFAYIDEILFLNKNLPSTYVDKDAPPDLIREECATLKQEPSEYRFEGLVD